MINIASVIIENCQPSQSYPDHRGLFKWSELMSVKWECLIIYMMWCDVMCDAKYWGADSSVQAG